MYHAERSKPGILLPLAISQRRFKKPHGTVQDISRINAEKKKALSTISKSPSPAESGSERRFGTPPFVPFATVLLATASRIGCFTWGKGFLSKGEFEMATATQNQGVITQAEFHASREYSALTDKQRKWVDIVVTTQDPERATAEAFGSTANDAYAKMLQGKLETSPRIVAALNLFYGRTERESLLAELERTIHCESGMAKVTAMSLYAKLKFSEPASGNETESSVQKFPIGAVIVQDDKKYLVKAEEIL
jgi:hypothetical protein